MTTQIDPYEASKSEQIKSLAQVQSKRDINQLVISISDIDRSLWLNGIDMYWKLPKDERPYDFRTEVFDEYDQATYELDDLARRYPLNQVPQIIVDNLAQLKQLSKLYADYKNHVLGLILIRPKFHDKLTDLVATDPDANTEKHND